MRIYHADTSLLAKVCGSWLTDESCTLGQHLAPGVVGTVGPHINQISINHRLCPLAVQPSVFIELPCILCRIRALPRRTRRVASRIVSIFPDYLITDSDLVIPLLGTSRVSDMFEPLDGSFFECDHVLLDARNYS